MRRLMIGIGAAMVLVAAATVSLVADTLVMRDGRRIRGELRSVRDGVIEFVEQRYTSSRTLRVNRDEVERIELDEARGVEPGLVGEERFGRPRGLREREISVAANVAWIDTGIDLRAGQTVYFEAQGTVRWGPDRRDGPEGEHDSPRNPGRPIPNRPGAALIGKIGESSSDVFFIGADQGPIRVPVRGRLFLGINDDFLGDNSGALRVTVYY
jgi:hypothetical protein